MKEPFIYLIFNNNFIINRKLIFKYVEYISFLDHEECVKLLVILDKFVKSKRFDDKYTLDLYLFVDKLSDSNPSKELLRATILTESYNKILLSDYLLNHDEFFLEILFRVTKKCVVSEESYSVMNSRLNLNRSRAYFGLNL